MKIFDEKTKKIIEKDIACHPDFDVKNYNPQNLKKVLKSITIKHSPFDEVVWRNRTEKINKDGKKLTHSSHMDDIFNEFKVEYKKILFCFQIITRAKRFDERIAGEHYFLGKQTIKQTRKYLNSNSREAILDQEEKNVSCKTVNRKISALLDDALEDDGNYYPSIKDCLMLTPSLEEIAYINKYINLITENSAPIIYGKKPEPDYKKIDRLHQRNSSLPRTTVVDGYEKEMMFYIGFVFDISPLIVNFYNFYNHTKWAINASKNDRITKKIYNLRFIEKASAFKIAYELGISEKKVQRTLSEKSEKYQNLKKMCEMEWIDETKFYDLEGSKNVQIYETNMGDLRDEVFALRNSIMMGSYLDDCTDHFKSLYGELFNKNKNNFS